MISYGQNLAWDEGYVHVDGCASSDQALWWAARMTRLPARKLRNVLTDDQRERLLKIAHGKLFN